MIDGIDRVDGIDGIDRIDGINGTKHSCIFGKVDNQETVKSHNLIS